MCLIYYWPLRGYVTSGRQSGCRYGGGGSSDITPMGRLVMCPFIIVNSFVLGDLPFPGLDDHRPGESGSGGGVRYTESPALSVNGERGYVLSQA